MTMGRDSSVGIATRCELRGPAIEARWWRPYPFRPALGPCQLPVQWVLGPFPGGKAAGVWRYHPPPSSPDVKESVQLRPSSPSVPSCPVLG